MVLAIYYDGIYHDTGIDREEAGFEVNTRTRAELALFATTFIWGSTFVVARLLSDSVSASLYIFLRFVFGALFFAIVFSKNVKTISRNTWKKGIILGAMLGSGIVIQNYGIYQTTASKSAFITGLMVIFTPMAQVFLEKRAPKLGNMIGILIVIGGLYLLTSPNGSDINFGDILVLISSVIFGVFIVYMDIFSKGEDPIQLSFTQILTTAIVAGISASMEHIRFEFSWSVGMLIAYMAIFATVITTYTQTRFQKETTPTRAVIIFTIEPVIAATLAYFVLHELLGVGEIVGGLLIIVGILISEFSDTISKKFGLGFSQ